MLTSFADFKLIAHLQRTLAEEGYLAPTPIQAQTIAPALEGRDVLGCAQTGTGKTAAFALPIIQRLLETEAPQVAPPQTDHRRKGRSGSHDQRARVLPRALILSPTRELASQICESFATYARGTRLRHTSIYGGVSQRNQERALRQGVDIVVATPGRLIDLLEQRVVDLSAITIFTLDEADRMLDMGFIEPIRRIAKAITTERQTLLFSATMPRKVAHLADSLLRNPVKVSVARSTAADPQIEQFVYRVARHDKQALLEMLIQSQQIERALVFTKTKHGAEKVRKKLSSVGISADAIHGNKSQSQRERALAGFRTGRSHVLVATDVAARGLDVDGITHVFNFDLPLEPEAYVHRIGRTARAGARGQAVAFCSPEERSILGAIEKLTGKRLSLMQPGDQRPAVERNSDFVATRPALVAGASERDGRNGRAGDGGRRPPGQKKAHRKGPPRQHDQSLARQGQKRPKVRPGAGGGPRKARRF